MAPGKQANKISIDASSPPLVRLARLLAEPLAFRPKPVAARKSEREEEERERENSRRSGWAEAGR